MMALVWFIDVLVEWIKYLGGAPGHRNVFVRILAWLYLIFLVVAGIALVVWCIAKIPDLVDWLNK